MKNYWFAFLGITVIIAGLLSAYLNSFTSYDFFGDLGILGTPLLLLASLIPGIFYLRVSAGKARQTALVQWAAKITLFGIALVLLSFIVELIACPGLKCDLSLVPTLFFGVIPAGILYGASLILLIIHWPRSYIYRD